MVPVKLDNRNVMAGRTQSRDDPAVVGVAARDAIKR
jgi:hypothetical protein